LESIFIPDGVTSIGNEAFFGCENMKIIYIHSADIARSIENEGSCENLVLYADAVYVKTDTTEVGSYLTSIPYATDDITIDGVSYTCYSKNAHACSYKWTSDATGHWRICDGCDYVGEKTEHVYYDSEDSSCNICGYTRQVQTTTTKPATTKPTTTDGDGGKGSDKKDNTATILIVVVASALVLGGVVTAATINLKKKK
jgi:hypothetical protein